MDSNKKKYIPFNKPFIVGKELFNISKAVISYSHLSGDGNYTRHCQKWLENKLICHKSLLTHSCTAALELSAILCDIQPGDEVIMPSYTFVSTANAFVLRGGVPVFVDIREDNLNVDETKIEAAISDKTKAIVPVHYAGCPCEMDTIKAIAEKYNALVIEDAAQAFFSSYKDRFLGTLGDLGTLSFHETKNVISGEGGALLINNEALVERAEIIWEKGTNRKKFFRGEVDKYTWMDIGSSFLPSEMIAAFLHAQLEQAETIIMKRRQIFALYYNLLKPLEEKGVIRLPYINKTIGSHNGHLFYIITKNADDRDNLMHYLRNKGIYAVFHYIPLHSSPAGKKFGRMSKKLSVTDSMSERLLRLPLFFEITNEEIEYIASIIKQFYDQKS